MMNAFHSFWSKPNTIRNQGDVSFPDFELYTAILSALEWKKHNGTIRMITDTPGAEYFRRLGIDGVWDELDTSLDEIGDTVDPFLFWAGGKLYALRQMETPCVMLDTDLIVWKNVDGMLEHDITAAHPENLNPYVYPPKEIFRLKEDYAFPAEWDFTLQAANTAFLYIRNCGFRDHYVDQAIRFFQNVETEGLNPVTAMCFGEQRILPMCAKAQKQDIGYLLGMEHPDDQDFVTHTWGFKQMFRVMPEAREEFCMRCTKRLMEEFPEMAPVLAQCEPLAQYYQKYKETMDVMTTE